MKMAYVGCNRFAVPSSWDLVPLVAVVIKNDFTDLADASLSGLPQQGVM
jgi:hypothetical protein